MRTQNKAPEMEFDWNTFEFPGGYRFCPLDDELITEYLQPKLLNKPVPYNKFHEVNINLYDPETLAAIYESYEGHEWYFFTPRDRKYKNGMRPNRAAGSGYWKATGKDKPVKQDGGGSGGGGAVIGFRKTLVFYGGKPPKGDKTDWIMHEFRLNYESPRVRINADDMRLDDWVLCKIYKKAEKGKRQEQSVEEGAENNLRKRQGQSVEEGAENNLRKRQEQSVEEGAENNLHNNEEETIDPIGSSSVVAESDTNVSEVVDSVYDDPAASVTSESSIPSCFTPPLQFQPNFSYEYDPENSQFNFCFPTQYDPRRHFFF
ncbi:NAC domain containing protein [Parasponia andersonii]|uniref:NAC domain containing protein n=1 Tax=Parasponia andersonii TaxID=3476 RepID=A0A2P5CDG3_PARAD|nr:NAC domain containing protein [Parasponia andersonii]